MSRYRTGCITCRLRKKKCDEQRPACQACSSRHLSCYGYNVPAPSWYIGSGNWKEVRDSAEAKSLRTLAETRYKIQRKIGLADDANELRVQSLEDPQPCRTRLLLARPALSDSRLFSSLFLLGSGTNIWQLRPETIWWDSKIRSLAGDPAFPAHGETRLLILFLEIIHPITHTFYRLHCAKDRGWMLNRLTSRQALYCSALSISACFDYSLNQPPTTNDIGICPKVRELQSKAVRELHIEIDNFAAMPSSPVEEFVWTGIQLLDVVHHLETLELFSMLQGHWEMHHQAARKILNHIEICASAGNGRPNSKSSIIEAVLLSNSLGDARNRSLKFSISNFVWIDVLAISTFSLLVYSPCAFDYLGLLESEIIEPQHIMGCEGWIMAVIAKIAILEHWKIDLGQMESSEFKILLSQRGRLLADELKDGITKLERGYSRATSRLEEDIRAVSLVWAHGAQVLSQVTLPVQPDEDQGAVNLCLQKLESLPTRLVMRTSWPYTIAGCMSTSESQHARFRAILGNAMQDAQPPGIAWKGLIVMEECWRLRQSGRKHVGWREAMESLGARVLLT